MRIHAPTKSAPDPNRTLDIERGAVTFDPWPFASVDVTLTTSFLFGELETREPPAEGQFISGDAVPGSPGKWNTLAYTLSGIPVIMSEAEWLEASK